MIESVRYAGLNLSHFVYFSYWAASQCNLHNGAACYFKDRETESTG